MIDIDKILNSKRPIDLYDRNTSNLEKEYKRLVKIFHPDINNHPKASICLIKITEMYNKAKNGCWEGKNFIKINQTNGDILIIDYLELKTFELGIFYITKNNIIYLIENKHKKFYDQMNMNINSFRFHNDKMKSEMQKYLPKIEKTFETVDGYLGVMISKDSDLILLKDVYNHFNKEIPDRHVAWVMTSIYNTICYFEWLGLVHNGITLDNCFISPKNHYISIFGGWWYSVKQGEKMIGVSKEIFDIMPPNIKHTKNALTQTDLESVRNIGRILLGYDSKAPKEILNWVNGVSSEDAVEDYKKWEQTLLNGYGKRTFIEMNLSSNDVY